jgi:transcriptional regulator with XRE-family HTH domain
MIKKKKCILAKILKQKNWSQMKLSQETGISQSVISRYCRDANSYKIDYLFAIKEALGLSSIEELFDDSP